MRTRLPIGTVAAIFACLLSANAAADPPKENAVTPLRRTHAHNDYEHKRPLFDALDQGFCSVEADIYLTNDGLLVAHVPWDLKKERTLQKLYLDPLRERAKANGGKIYPNGPTIHLLIDVKTEAKKTCEALAKVLEDYADILSVSKDGKFTAKAVTAVVSGNCDRDTFTKQSVRYAGIDGRPADLDSDAAVDLIPWVSASWSSQFKWNGTGSMPAAELAKLKDFVTKAHKHNRLVRFWGLPDKPEVWGTLLSADVDLINTDKLVELRAFLLKNDTKSEK